MNSNLATLKDIFDLNNKLVLKSFEVLNQKNSHKQFSEDTNSAIWLIGHILWAKAGGVAHLLGVEVSKPQWLDQFAKDITKLDKANFPQLKELQETWQTLHKKIETALPSLSEEQLNAEQSMRFPTSDNSVLAGLAFLGQHESYHVGQISYILRLLDEKGLFKLAFSPN